MSIGVTIQETVTPRLQVFLSGLRRRKGLHEMISNRAGRLTKSHLIDLSRTRHKTAAALGARPTGHLGRAAESVASTSSEESATISITSPGFARVGRDLEIRPVNGQWLTVPIDRLGYGVRVRELERNLGTRLFRPRRADGSRSRILALREGKGKNARLRPVYALVRRVRLRQDRTLLPSNAQFSGAALKGINDYVAALLAEKGKA